MGEDVHAIAVVRAFTNGIGCVTGFKHGAHQMEAVLTRSRDRWVVCKVAQHSGVSSTPYYQPDPQTRPL